MTRRASTGLQRCVAPLAIGIVAATAFAAPFQDVSEGTSDPQTEGGLTVEGKTVEKWFSEGADWQWPSASTPVVSVRFGRTEEGAEGNLTHRDVRIAVGAFAFGDVAIGAWGIGGVALGGLAVGGICLGLLTIGGVNLGLAAIGGVAVGWAFALGGVAVGRTAFGAVAIGRNAYGCVAIGKRAYGIVAIGAEGWGLIPLTGSFVKLFSGQRDRTGPF